MTIPFVTIEIDKPRRLRYDPNAIADLEGVLGMGLSAIFREDLMGIRVLRALLWCGLKWEDRGLTLERAGQLILTFIDKGNDLQVLGDKITEALQNCGWLKKAGGVEEGEEGNGTGA